MRRLLYNRYLRTCCSFVYNIFYSKFLLTSKSNNIEYRNTFCKLKKVKIEGSDNSIIIGRDTRLLNCKIIINGSNNKIRIGKKCRFCDVTLWIDDDGNEICIGDGTTIEGAGISAMEGTNLHIGNNCMLSHHIEIRTGDSHSILRDGIRVNKSENISIGDNVWIGARAMILKGSYIASGCIIGIASLVNKKLLDENSVYAGMPVRKVSGDITWSRERIV